jgi:uncharacterized protein YegP (UPF0339 family)
VFEDNGGDYCWTILGSDGEGLAHSRPYATRDDAAHAALTRDDSDAERWLDKGGGFSSAR